MFQPLILFYFFVAYICVKTSIVVTTWNRDLDLWVQIVWRITAFSSRMAFFALKDGMEKKARKQAFDKMFARFDHNHNGENWNSKNNNNVELAGKVFVKDFFEEMTQAGVEVDEEEVKKLTSYAGSDGQVTKDHFKSYCKHSEMFKGLDK